MKISDFGLARLHLPERAMSRTDTILPAEETTVMGTPDYLSPEQARNLHSVDIRSDLYSLGCTFYFLLTGQVPFPGGTALEKLVRHGSEEPVPIVQLRADVPPAVSALIAKLLQKNPDLRLATPADLAAALAPLAEPGSAIIVPFHTGAAGKELPSTGALPWADLFGSDEHAALGGTIPANVALTPTSALSTRRQKSAAQPARQATRRRWLRIAIIVAAAVAAGFALGALTLAKLATVGG